MTISKTRKPLRQLALRAAVNRHWREKRQCLSPAPFSAHWNLAQIRPKPARNPSLRLGCYPPRNNRTQRLTRANKGDFCVECLFCWMIQQAGGSGCARLQRVSASSGVAAPQGCGNPILWLQHGHFCTSPGLANNRNFQSRLLDVPTSIAKPSVFCYNILKGR